MRAIVASMLWVLAASTPGVAGEITREDFFEKNGIDPEAPAFVRIERADLPNGCDRAVVESFVDANETRWSSLQRDQFRQYLASTDGDAEIEVELEVGKATKSTLMLDSTDSIALMQLLQTDFATIRFPARCHGTARIRLRFHLPTAERDE
ncbi:hypothetical protein K2X89_03020 [Myxococcota bacterium]|nr:hypothetical protein [Myxococcota bacterium]